MTIPKRQVSFFIARDEYKKFSKKCIDLDKTKTQMLKELIEKFIEN